MKRIVLLTDPHRLNKTLVRRLQRLFPECDLEIVAVTTEDRQAPKHRLESAESG
jgi:hypothetical protein